MQQGERKMKDYRQSPSFWPYALLSQRITLSPRRISPFSRRVIFTCSCISLTLLSLRENGDYSKSYYMQVEIASLEREETGLSKLWQRFLTLFNTRDREEKLVNSWPVRLPSNNPRNNKTYYGSNSLLRIKKQKWTLFECQCIFKHKSTKWGHYFYISYWRWDCHFTWSSKPR